MKLLIVESPAKAKTIKNYLDHEYDVVASIGHFRDLPQSGIGIDEKNDFYVKKWEIDKKKIDPVLSSIKKSNEIFLALDPDREGELIAWHLVEVCKEKNIYNNKDFKRIEFSAVRKEDILSALQKPRKINHNLVYAAITRRFLDRFFGYKISPITKRRTVFGTSAGRVQSPALKILAEKEKEVDEFTPKEFWEVSVELKTEINETLKCSIVEVNNKKIDKLFFSNKKMADNIKETILLESFFVSDFVTKEKRRNPYSPFSNSLLLQDSSSKLGFSPKYTNKLAQELKDGIGNFGALISYHRTDSNVMNKGEIKKLRNQIDMIYGKQFISEKEILYKEKSKFVQQGHEAVTPTDFNNKPENVKKFLSDDQFKLYDLIWKRTFASQMAQSINLETIIFIQSKNLKLKAVGSILKFKGFKEVYNFVDNTDDVQRLPQISKNQHLVLTNAEIKQNFTKPPNRYSEAGLIKKLEELGIGRPSTYVSIFTKLIERNYVEIKNKALIPTSKGKVLSKFLDGFFNRFVDYKFTADLEGQLDLITESKLDWKETLNDFLKTLNQTVNEVEQKSISEVIDKINQTSPEILKEKKCPKCSDGSLTIKFAFSGPFVGCSNFSKSNGGCKYSFPLGVDEKNKDLFGEGISLGFHPENKKEIVIKSGRYGRYLELKNDSDKPKRVGIPKNIKIEDLDLQMASKFLDLPRSVGFHPETKKEIIASIGPYGPYLKHNNKFISLKDDSVTEIGINRSVELIDQKIKETKEILVGVEPLSKKQIIIKKGIKGRSDYIIFEKKNYGLPENLKPEEVSIEIALKIIDEKKKRKAK